MTSTAIAFVLLGMALVARPSMWLSNALPLHLLRAGVPLHVASRLAAHGDIATTMRYVSTGIDPLEAMLAEPNQLPRVQSPSVNVA